MSYTRPIDIINTPTDFRDGDRSRSQSYQTEIPINFIPLENPTVEPETQQQNANAFWDFFDNANANANDEVIDFGVQDNLETYGEVDYDDGLTEQNSSFNQLINTNDVIIDIEQQHSIETHNEKVIINNESKVKRDVNLPEEKPSIIQLRREVRNQALGRNLEAIVINENNEEEKVDPLPSQGWISWGANGIANACKATGRGVYNVAAKVVSSPITSTASFITAIPSALYALDNPRELGKFPQKSIPEMVYSVVNSASSLGINTLMNAFYFPTAYDKLKTTLTEELKGKSDLVERILSSIFGLSGAFAAGAISFGAFHWLVNGGVYVGSVFAVISFVATLSSRFIGVRNVLKRIHNLFNEDAIEQEKFAEALDHINPDYLLEIQNEFDKIMKELFQDRDFNSPLTAKDFEAISNRLVDVLSEFEKKHPDLIKGTPTHESVAKYTGMLFDLFFGALMIGYPAGLTFMQKGFDGVKTMAGFAHHDLTDMYVWWKRCIGAIPGLASGMLYADSASKLRGILVELTQHAYENPSDIPFMITALVANGFAANGPLNVAKGISSDPNNVTGIYKNTLEAWIYYLENAFGGGIVNFNSSMARLFLLSKPNPDFLHVEVKDVAKNLHKVNENPLSHEVTQKFKFFNNKDENVKSTAPLYQPIAGYGNV